MSRVGASLRSARLRLGWSREDLAYHSRLSTAAIAQIESGRRREVRLSSLLALANALRVSVDYLVGGSISPKLLEHSALIYSSDDEYVASATAFLREGLERDECVMAVTGRSQIDLLRDALGDDAKRVEFRHAPKWYGRPQRTLNEYRTYMRKRLEEGATWIRVLGEPVWDGRSDAEVIEWTRYESMINLSLASQPATIMCPYDARSTPDAVLAGAHCTHLTLAQAGTAATSPTYREPEDFLLTQT